MGHSYNAGYEIENLADGPAYKCWFDHGELALLHQAEMIVILVSLNKFGANGAIGPGFAEARESVQSLRPVVTVFFSEQEFQKIDLGLFKENCDALVCPDAVWMPPYGYLRIGDHFDVHFQLAEWCQDWFVCGEDLPRKIFIDMGVGRLSEADVNMKMKSSVSPVDALLYIYTSVIQHDRINPPERKIVKRHEHVTYCQPRGRRRD